MYILSSKVMIELMSKPWSSPKGFGLASSRAVGDEQFVAVVAVEVAGTRQKYLSLDALDDDVRRCHYVDFAAPSPNPRNVSVNSS